MKWAIPQLLKNGSQPFEINELVDFTDIARQHADLRALSKVTITGTGHIESGKHVHFNITIQGEMTLGCAQTLEDVILPFEIVAEEIFTLDPREEGIDDYHKPHGQTIDITPIVWQNIVVEIPIRVVNDKAKKLPQKGKGWKIMSEEDYEQVINQDEKEDNIDPRMSKLLDLLKDDE